MNFQNVHEKNITKVKLSIEMVKEIPPTELTIANDVD